MAASTKSLFLLGAVLGSLAVMASKRKPPTDAGTPDRKPYREPSPGVITVPTEMMTKIMHPYRDAYGHFPKVHSGVRTAKENVDTGGAADSDHMMGLALDISDPSVNAGQLAVRLRDILPEWDQIIAYALPKRSLGGRGGHVHIGMGERMRQEMRIGPNGSQREYLDVDDAGIDAITANTAITDAEARAVLGLTP